MGRILLYHLSDLHFGSHQLGTESNIDDRRDGHHYQTARELQYSVTDPFYSRTDFGVTADDKLAMVVGGDLTRIGSHYDFQQSYTYLHSELKWRKGRLTAEERLGLNWQGEFYAVPGNHDHWNNFRPDCRIIFKNPSSWLRSLAPASLLVLTRPPAFNPQLAGSYFEKTPWHHPISSACGKFSVELFGVDSNSGLKGTNLRARGEISDAEFRGLEADLARVKANAKGSSVAAIVCHHAFAFTGLGDARPLSDASRKRLLEIARQFDVRAVLTGHVHCFNEHEWNAAQPRVWELTCGTSLQLSRGVEKYNPGYYVHEFALDPNGATGWNSLKWDAWKYRSMNGGVFQRADKPTPITR